MDDAIGHDKYWESPLDGYGQGLSWMSERIFIVLKQMQTQPQPQIQFYKNTQIQVYVLEDWVCSYLHDMRHDKVRCKIENCGQDHHSIIGNK